MSARHTVIIRLPADLIRRLEHYLGGSGPLYASIDDFITTAVRNQLHLESLPSGRVFQSVGDTSLAELHTNASDEQPNAISDLLARPPAFSVAPLGECHPTAAERLFVFTNRLSPLKVAVRVAANLASSGVWPELAPFQEQAASAARQLGLRLRQTDRASRRWIAYPVGGDPRKSAARFVSSFAITTGQGGPAGPLALLGLASLRDGRVVLSREGWKLAVAPSPLIDGADGHTLSQPEIQIFSDQLRGAKAEDRACRQFLSTVAAAGPTQRLIDEALRNADPEWTADMVVAQRAALLGRLSDLGFVTVSGRGSSAHVEVTQDGHHYLNEGEAHHE
jgi:hypothetical protein